jgi:hypothetical protein
LDAFWRYVRIQRFALVCGPVGPIFLVTYFALHPEPTKRRSNTESDEA